MENFKHIISTNIVRDTNVDIGYVVTPNARLIAHQILSKYRSGQSCFSIIGSYGTGKSSFLWALQKNLTGLNDYFFEMNGQFNGGGGFETINIVGSYASFSEVIRKQINAENNSTEAIFDRLSELSKDLAEEGKRLLIFVDEFGKILEHAAVNQPERAMYFIQEFAEFCNDPIRKILFITALHQNFGAYTEKLSFNQKQEWVKTKGRFEDLTFNEPIEQLLYLASQRIQAWIKNNNATNNNEHIPFFDIAKKYNHLSNSLKGDYDLAQKLFPLDIIAASLLTKGLQKYGQNERSLFTFLSNNNEESIINAVNANRVYSIVDVFDYLFNNFFSFLITTLNEDKNHWDSIRNSLIRVRNIFEKEYPVGETLVKIIGLTNVLGEPGSKINDDFFQDYIGKLGFSKSAIKKGLRTLVENKIIYYRGYSNRYVLTEGTDINYELELLKAEASINLATDMISDVKKYFKTTHEIARRISFEKGTSRFFEYMLTETPIKDLPNGEIDGIINVVFNDRIRLNELKQISEATEDAIIHVYFPKNEILKEYIIDIKKINHVIKEYSHDKVAVNELTGRKLSVIKYLNSLLNESLFKSSSNVVWFFKGQKKEISNAKSLNKLLSNICDEIYSGTPVIHNELFNKQVYSSQISTARKNYLKNLIECNNEELLGFAKDNFPPEKTIYLSLLEKTGIHRQDGSGYKFDEPMDDSFTLLWNASRSFLNDTKKERLCISNFIEILRNKPFRLKKGFTDFWIPTFLVIHRNEFALFNDTIYVPYLTSDLMDLILKSPGNFYIKCYNVEGVKLDVFNKYRELINKKAEQQITQQVFIETIKPFIVFYRDLPDYSKQTLRLSPAAVELRNAIASSPDPETAFFVDFPKALGYDPNDIAKTDFDLSEYVAKLHNTIREIRSSYEELLYRIENFFLNETGNAEKDYHAFKNELVSRFESVEINLLADIPKRILSRIRTPYENKIDFFNSLSFVLLEKTISTYKDDDEPIFCQSFLNQYRALNRIIPIHKLSIKNGGSDLFGVDFILPNGESRPYVIGTKSHSRSLINKAHSDIDKVLRKHDTETQKRILLNYLKNLITNEG